MTKYFCQFQSLLIFFFSVRVFSQLIGMNVASFDNLGHAALAFLVPTVSILFALIGLCLQNPWQRFGQCISFILTLFFLYSTIGKINHSIHIWMFSSIFVCFIDIEKTLNSKRNHLLVRLIQSTLLSQYFIAGVWKLRLVLSSSSLDQFFLRPLDYLAYSIAEGNGPAELLRDIILDTRFVILIQVGFLSIILFQVSSIVPVLTNRYWSIWGFLAIAFHLSTGIFMGIWFWETILAAAFFLIIFEFRLSKTHTQGSTKRI